MNAGINATTAAGMSARRWLAGAGLVFVLAWILGLTTAFSAPGPAAEGNAVAFYYMHNQQAQLLQTYLIDGVAGAALLVFVAALHALFRQMGEAGAPDGGSVLPNVVLGAGIAAASVSFVQAGIGSALTHPEVLLRAGVSGIQMLVVFVNDMDTFKLLALAMLTGGAAIYILQRHMLPAWVGWLGALEAVLLFLGGLSFILINISLYSLLYVALPLLLVWIAAIAVTAWMSGGMASRPRPSVNPDYQAR